MASSDEDKLAYWAALNGQEPLEYIRAQRDYQAQQASSNTDAKIRNYQLILNQPFKYSAEEYNDALAGLRAAEAEKAQQASTATYTPYSDLSVDIGNNSAATQARLDPYQTAANDAYNNNQTVRAQNLANQTSAFNQATAGNAALFKQQQQATQQRNAADDATLSAMRDAYGQASAMDASNVGQLQSTLGGMSQLQAQQFDPTVASNPQYVGMQQAAYDDFGGWASGAHDISSDPALVAQQQGVYEGFGQFSSGAMDLESQAALAQADPESIAAQKEALGEFRERMDPKLTDAERFLYMQSRLAQEQSQRAVRDANYRELERRGMGGSTMALSNLNASSAEAGNTRALQDLGANAKAIDRAEKALVNYGNLSSNMREQSFTEDFSTKSAADRMAINNNQQRLAGLQGQGTMANSMRASDDAIRMQNQSMQMEGTKGQATMATNMRNADDAINMFNSEQKGIQSRHVDDYNAQQQRDAMTRAGMISDAGFRQTEGLDRRTANSTNSALTASQNQWTRGSEDTRTGQSMNRDYLAGYDQITGRANEGMRDAGTDLGRSTSTALERERLAQDAYGQQTNIRGKIIDNKNEDRRAKEASDAARQQQEDQQEFEDDQRSVFDYIF